MIVSHAPSEGAPPLTRFAFAATADLIPLIRFFRAAEVDAHLSIPLPTVLPLGCCEAILAELRDELVRREWVLS